jgi:hypothetical protein|tara:strand:- start:33 stop:209 length:177 start_codon:yes stop_codon:yes gene_type:complete
MAKTDKEPFYKGNISLDLNKDGYQKGGKEIKISKGPVETKVGGQRRMLASKKSKAKWC